MTHKRVVRQVSPKGPNLGGTTLIITYPTVNAGVTLFFPTELQGRFQIFRIRASTNALSLECFLLVLTLFNAYTYCLYHRIHIGVLSRGNETFVLGSYSSYESIMLSNMVAASARDAFPRGISQPPDFPLITPYSTAQHMLSIAQL